MSLETRLKIRRANLAIAKVNEALEEWIFTIAKENSSLTDHAGHFENLRKTILRDADSVLQELEAKR